MASHGSSLCAAGPASDGRTSADGSGAGFIVYGSLFKTDPRYEFLNPLGKGSYGIVCAAKDRNTGQRIAIKKVCPMAKRSVDAKHTLREVLLLQLLGKHPNIISIHNLSTNPKDDELYIVMDLMDTDMHRVIQSSQTLSESHVKYFLHQLLRGVKYLHEHGVLHRDLKPGNLLLTKTCQLKIADFGLARKTLRTGSGSLAMSGHERPRSAPAMSSSSSSSSRDRAPMTEHVVTRWYRAPELMLQPDGCYDESIDMWSVGCIFAEILGRKALFPGKNFLHQLTLIFDMIGTPPHDATARIKSSQAQRFLKSLGKKPRVPFRTVFPAASDEALDLLERLLEFDPEKRISAQEALAHPFMLAIERKYKGVDPHPSARVDFSFDTKQLTKMDLRALIIKEVESFRRSVAHTAEVDAELTLESEAEKSLAASSTSKLSASAQHTERETAKQRPASASAATASNGRVMCGSAGISMIHSAMRHRLEAKTTVGSDCGASAPYACSGRIKPSSSTTATTLTAHSSATIGSNRQRIRVTTKPPVPKQPLAPPNGVATAEPHSGMVRVVAAQDTKNLLASLTESIRETAIEGDTVPNHPVSSVTGSDGAAGSRLSVTQPLATTPAELPKKTGTDDQNDGAKAAAVKALSTFEKRARMLVGASAGVSTTWAAPVASLDVANATTNGNAHPEISRSPASAAFSSSSSSSASSEKLDKRDGTRPTARAGLAPPVNTPGLLHRRVASAGPIRPKPGIGSGSVQKPHNSTLKPQTKQGAGATAFVGSTTSLIRAQRSSNGKSLADSADQMVATITGQRGAGLPQDARPSAEPRDEANFDGDPPPLKPQRSMAQLNQLEPSTKKPTRKLTVPRSPKFSVMSWQKKKGIRPARVPALVDPVAGDVDSRRL